MNRNIIEIPAKKKAVLRVAAYCRVSTAYEEQQTSLDGQIQYYTEYINNHEGWVLADEAQIVRLIYDLYLNGHGCRKIKSYLENNGIKTVTGKTEWSTSTIDRILSNEKYIVTVLSQKSYVANCLTHKQVKNNGELPMYLMENIHEAIISNKVFEEVQRMKSL